MQRLLIIFFLLVLFLVNNYFYVKLLFPRILNALILLSQIYLQRIVVWLNFFYRKCWVHSVRWGHSRSRRGDSIWFPTEVPLHVTVVKYITWIWWFLWVLLYILVFFTPAGYLKWLIVMILTRIITHKNHVFFCISRVVLIIILIAIRDW